MWFISWILTFSVLKDTFPVRRNGFFQAIWECCLCTMMLPCNQRDVWPSQKAWFLPVTFKGLSEPFLSSSQPGFHNEGVVFTDRFSLIDLFIAQIFCLILICNAHPGSKIISSMLRRILHFSGSPKASLSSHLSPVILKQGCIFFDIPSIKSQDLCLLHLDPEQARGPLQTRVPGKRWRPSLNHRRPCGFHFVHWNTCSWRCDSPRKEVWWFWGHYVVQNPRYMERPL